MFGASIPPGILSFQVEFVDKFKLVEDIISCCSGHIKSSSFHLEKGKIYYLADTFDIAVVNNSISILYIDVIFLSSRCLA